MKDAPSNNQIPSEDVISSRTFWLLQIIWLAALPGTFYLICRLIYEMTFLTWAKGPQMVGFTLVHKNYFGLLLISVVVMAVWVIAVILLSVITWLCNKKIHKGLLLLALATFLFVGIIYVPWSNAWIRTMVYFHPGEPVPFGTAHLRLAAGQGDLKMVKFLLDHGVPVNVRDKVLGRYYVTAVRAAADNVIPFLIERGADVNLADGYGRTPLMDCAEANAVSKTQLLLKYGADTKLRDDRGETAFDIAKRTGNYQILKLLDPNRM